MLAIIKHLRSSLCPCSPAGWIAAIERPCSRRLDTRRHALAVIEHPRHQLARPRLSRLMAVHPGTLAAVPAPAPAEQSGGARRAPLSLTVLPLMRRQTM